ncbi:MAG: right-handed parallel beta-helix repeat-containing protein [Verrucomicrobiota bacterium]
MDNPLTGKLKFLYALIVLTGWVASDLASQEVVTLKAGDGLQAAIDAAEAGTVIELAEGLYAERIFIDKPIAIRGTGENPSTIRPNELPAPQGLELIEQHQAKLKAAANEDERFKHEIDFRRSSSPPVVFVVRAQGVLLENLRISTPPAESDIVNTQAIVEVIEANVTMDRCQVVGPWANGIFAAGKSVLTVKDSFVAAVWGTGIAIFGTRDGEPGKTVISGTEVRNCHRRGIGATKGTYVTIENCRISGSGGHGIRYDDTSPTIVGNVISGNADSGIYANGVTEAKIEGNVFWKNGNNGISCWYMNKDQIVRNTFAENGNEAIAVLGAGSPSIMSNVFASHPTAVVLSLINNSTRVGAMDYGEPKIEGNFYWKNEFVRTKASKEAGQTKEQFPAGKGEVSGKDPLFADPGSGDFSMKEGSPALASGAGAKEAIPAASPVALQSEELLIIPDGDTRAADAWKRPASQEDAQLLGSIRGAVMQWRNGVSRIKNKERRLLEIEEMRKMVEKLAAENQ